MRKKLFVLFSVLTLATGVNAQINVGGSLGYSSSKVSTGGVERDGSSYLILPEVSYQLMDNLSVGVQAGYAHGFASFGTMSTADFKSALTNVMSISANVSEDDIKLNSYTFAPFARYNVLEVGPAKVFIEGSIGYSNIKTEGNAKTGGKRNFDSFEFALRPGLSIGLGEHLSAIVKIGALGYISAKEKESDTKITHYGLSVDSQNLLLGLNYKF